MLASVVEVHRLGYSPAGGLFPDQEWKQRSMHWQGDS